MSSVSRGRRLKQQVEIEEAQTLHGVVILLPKVVSQVMTCGPPTTTFKRGTDISGEGWKQAGFEELAAARRSRGATDRLLAAGSQRAGVTLHGNKISLQSTDVLFHRVNASL